MRSPVPGQIDLSIAGYPDATGLEWARDDAVTRLAPGVNTASLTGLDIGVLYRWDARSCNAAGCSRWHGKVGKFADGSDAADRILFSRRVNGVPPGPADIYTMYRDGAHQTRLTNGAGDNFDAVWSPDRRKIAFASSRDGNNEIYVMNADGSEPHNLTIHPADDRSPTWSPDGKRIAFHSTRSGNGDVWVMNADGSQPMLLTFTASR